MRLERAERPKHWLFAPIPLDRQGKRVQALLRAKFARQGDSAFGRVHLAALHGDKAEMAIELPPELIWFEGHFPGQPILPGIAQVHIAAQWAECLWGWAPTGADLSQMKFRHVIRPGDMVRL